MTELTITFREAVPSDAEQLLEVTKKIGSETEFLVMDENGMSLTPELLAHQLDALYESENNVLLLALAGEQIIGTASIKADSHYRVSHIGEIGISILKEYWGMGIGTLLMEELIEWAKESQTIYRLELTVQARNERAVHIYEKMGFEVEARMPRGARSDAGEFLDVYLMRYLIN